MLLKQINNKVAGKVLIGLQTSRLVFEEPSSTAVFKCQFLIL